MSSCSLLLSLNKPVKWEYKRNTNGVINNIHAEILITTHLHTTLLNLLHSLSYMCNFNIHVLRLFILIFYVSY
jgi:hypothetical protein